MFQNFSKKLNIQFLSYFSKNNLKNQKNQFGVLILEKPTRKTWKNMKNRNKWPQLNFSGVAVCFIVKMVAYSDSPSKIALGSWSN